MTRRPAAFVIDCQSPDRRRETEDLVRARINLLNTMTSTQRAFPNGVEQRTVTKHRLSDYFDDIRIEHQSDDSKDFRLVFNPRKDADRYWKDLMVQILGGIRTIQNVSVKSA